MAINVYFVRHGQTYLNLYHRMQGWSDSPLTEKGLADAARAGQALAKVDFDYAFSSDLKRTMETAHELLANHPGKLTDATPDRPGAKNSLATLKGSIPMLPPTRCHGNSGPLKK